MIYRGRVLNGVIVIDDEALLPEGAEVEVHIATPLTPTDKSSLASATTVGQRLAGLAANLPEYASKRHDG